MALAYESREKFKNVFKLHLCNQLHEFSARGLLLESFEFERPVQMTALLHSGLVGAPLSFLEDVRFLGESGRRRVTTSCPLMTRRGHGGPLIH
jgi:hypothetical protein